MVTIEVFHNPQWYILQMLVFLVCVTALTFIAVLILCGFQPKDLEEA